MKLWQNLKSFAAVIGFLLFAAPAAVAQPFLVHEAAFTVRANGQTIPYQEAPLFVMPNEVVNFEFDEPGVNCRADSGVVSKSSPQHCLWTAPATVGSYEITLSSGANKINLNTFVLVPFSTLKAGKLNNYRVGDYTIDTARHREAYQLPRGFIEVTEKNQDSILTPHFKLSQFLCKQESGYPKYVVLQEKLLYKLEQVLGEMNRTGHNADTFFVMSGYRTPHYNQQIENVRLSRHVFGDAADVFIPGQSPTEHARYGLAQVHFISRVVNMLEKRPFFNKYIGGMGVYPATSNHPPFVHIDVRGWPARW